MFGMLCMLTRRVLHIYAAVAMTPRLTISSQGYDRNSLLKPVECTRGVPRMDGPETPDWASAV